MNRIDAKNQAPMPSGRSAAGESDDAPELTPEHQRALEKLGYEGKTMDDFLEDHPKVSEKKQDAEDGDESVTGWYETRQQEKKQKKLIEARLVLPTVVQNQKDYHDAVTGDDE